MNLEELKAANAAQEAAQAEPTETETEELETEEVEETGELEGEEQTVEEDGEVEDPGGGGDDPEVEDWMQGDDQASQDSDLKFGDSDIAKVRRKYKGKLKEEQDRVAKLEAELESLKQRPAQPAPQQNAPARPKRSDFDDHDDPDEAFTEALTDWKWEVRQAEQNAKHAESANQQKHQELVKQVQESVDQHYDRAVELSEKSGISADMYRSADLRVRQAIDRVMKSHNPQWDGDMAVDQLIHMLGKGSEKVMYSIGVNSSKLNELENRLRQDPSGALAGFYLGELKAGLKPPEKRKSNAPKPPPEVNGDAKASGSVRQMQKRYKEAQSSGNVQAAYNAKKEARKAGIDTSNW